MPSYHIGAVAKILHHIICSIHIQIGQIIWLMLDTIKHTHSQRDFALQIESVDGWMNRNECGFFDA